MFLGLAVVAFVVGALAGLVMLLGGYREDVGGAVRVG